MFYLNCFECIAFFMFFLTLLVIRCRRTLEVIGGGYYNHGLKKLFPGRFLTVSLHISILLYIRTSDSRGNVSSFKTQDLGALQKSDPKARKSSASEFIKEKLKKLRGGFLSRAAKRNSEQLEPSNFL